MHARIQRRQAVLLLVAILAPCCLLVVLAARMYRQESELVEKRAGEERQRLRDQTRLELLNRLERIKLDELTARERSRALVFVAAVHDGRIRLPWDLSGQVENAAPVFAKRVQEGERLEFALRQPADAARNYSSALSAAKSPAQAASTSLSLARVLEESAAQRLYGGLLASTASDEYGIPFAFYAASRLLEKGRPILDLVQREMARPCCLPLPAMYLLRDLANKSGATQFSAPLESRIQKLERAEALRSEFPRLLPLISGPDAVWAAYGDPPWLIGLARESLIVIDSGPVISSLAGHPRIAATGEAIGANFPGLRLVFPSSNHVSNARSLERFFFIALTLAATVALFGGYLLFRDVRREAHLARMRSQFVASVSHELKTPLTAIRMFAENLQSRPEAAPMQSEYLDIIVNESERLSRLVDNVLDFSKIEQGRKLYNMREVSLDEVVRTVARAIEYPLTQKGFTLRLDSVDGIPPVHADADALKQAILNLLINAMKYSGESRDISLRLTAASREALIEVRDHGVGIPPEEQQRIFERFYRVPNPENKLVSGAGLGLPLVRHIAEAHGGTVDVESAPGRGSAFTIRLPMEYPA